MTEATDTRAVFVVHGRNVELRDAMFTFLRSIDLSPIEWIKAIEWTGEGSPYIGRVLDVALERAAAIVILMTPDEIAYLQPRYGSGEDDPQTLPAQQARPNVLFEAGMALGRDARRSILVEIGDVRPFSDVAGRHVVRLTNDVEKRQELATRLRGAGCAVDLSGTDWHRAGDFTTPTLPGAGLPLGRRLPSTPQRVGPIEFDARYVDKGRNRIDRLQVFNRGTETAYDVQVVFPEGAALSRQGNAPIAKIPGGGRSVSIDVMNSNMYMGSGDTQSAFDITITGRTETGEIVSQEVFMDVNS